MKKLFTMAFAVLAVAAFIGFSATSSDAVHKGSGMLTCGGCHTMHNSQGGGSLGGSPTAVLLRGATGATYTFCLGCHAENSTSASASSANAGSNVAPPKVWLTASTSVSAGGNFNGTLNNTAGTWGDNDGTLTWGRGHSVGNSGSVVPPGGTGAVAISCTSCHDPHGADVAGGWSSTVGAIQVNLFRNLKTIPVGSGGTGITLTSVMGWAGSTSNGLSTTKNWIGAGTSTGASHYWPVASPSGAATASNVYYQADGGGISRWCAQCHDDWHESNVTNTSGSYDWVRHPVDNALVDGTPTSGSGVTIVSWATYDSSAESAKLPAAQKAANTPSGTTGGGNNVFYANEQDDKVFCLSCHYAHGGPYFDNLRWDYLSAVTAGGQTPNGVATGVGCNICHNK